MGLLIKRILAAVLLVAVIFGFRYCWTSFPIATGFGAKILCSSVCVAGRNEDDIKAQELRYLPLNLITHKLNYNDSFVTTSLLGFAKRKAIYRKGLGATLISELPEEEVRNQKIILVLLPVVQQDSVLWPLGDQLPDSIQPGINLIQLRDAVNKAFESADVENPIGTRAVVVVYDGKLVAEKYAPGFTKDTRLNGWSMTKSITNALIGILVKENKLDIDAPAPVSEWQKENDPRSAITTKHLLQQTSGLDFEEDYSKSSDATRMLFQKGDMAAYVASRPLKDKPGQLFYYSSGNSNILSRMIREIVGEPDYHAFPYRELFHKLGMYSAILEPDASGTFVGSSYSYATARDWARFGLLYINDGVYNKERILPEGWVKQTTTPSPAAKKGEYGFQFWLNRGKLNNSSGKAFTGVPPDMFYAGGFEGQNVFIVPSKKLVVVRLGLTRNKTYDANVFLSDIIKAVD
ncbi:MAG: serine hydrolase domain-containing protein [Chitinophagaceae bacterium]